MATRAEYPTNVEGTVSGTNKVYHSATITINNPERRTTHHFTSVLAVLPMFIYLNLA
jgi:hypothetical protein